MDTETRVRAATPEDAASLAELYAELTSNDPNIRVDPERLRELSFSDSTFLYVAESSGSIVGTIFLVICPDAMYGRQPFAVIENLVVGTRIRGRGIGKALIRHAESKCRELRCTKVMLLSSSRREEAHAFFAAQSYEGDSKRGFVKYLNRQNPSASSPPGL